MEPSRYVTKLLFSSLLGALSLVSLNYFADVYRVFHAPPTRFSVSFEPNTRFLKTAYLSEHCSEFDTLVFGNSQSVAYRSTLVDDRFGAQTYNYGVSEETPIGVWQKLQWLDSISCFPKRILLSVSVSHIDMVDYSQPGRLLRFEHYYVSDLPRLEFFRYYLASLRAVLDSLDVLLSKALRGPEDRLTYDMTRGDVYYNWDEQFEIAPCPTRRVDLPGSLEFADKLGAIKDFAETRGAEVALVWNPNTVERQASVNAESFERLIGHLARHFERVYRIPVTDDRLSDSRHYRDSGHFNPELAADVLLPENLVATKQLVDELEAYLQRCD